MKKYVLGCLLDWTDMREMQTVYRKVKNQEYILIICVLLPAALRAAQAAGI